MMVLVIIFYYIALFVSFILFIGGTIMLIAGIKKRVKTKAAPKPRGLALIIVGVFMFLSGGIGCVPYDVITINDAIEKRNNIYTQLWSGTAEDVERCLKNKAYSPEELGKKLIEIGHSDAAKKVALLIEYGADVNVVVCPYCEHGSGSGGYCKALCSSTPVLYWCNSYRPNYKILKVLIDNGGDVNATDYFGYSALDIVEREINNSDRLDPEKIEILKHMKELLIENGAKNGPREIDPESDRKYKLYENYDYY